jgi:hypothetical protein
MIALGAQYMVTHTHQKNWQEYLSKTNVIAWEEFPDDLKGKISYYMRKFRYQFEGDIEQADIDYLLQTIVDQLNYGTKLRKNHEYGSNIYNKQLDTLVRSIFDKKFTPDKNDKLNLTEDDWKDIVFHTISNSNTRILLESKDRVHKLELKYRFSYTSSSGRREWLSNKTHVRIRYIGPQTFAMLPEMQIFKKFGKKSFLQEE